MKNYQLIYYLLPFPSLILKPKDSSFIVEDLNEEFINITGAKREHLLGLNIADALPSKNDSYGFNGREIEIFIAQFYTSGTAIKIVKQEIKDSDSGAAYERLWQVEVIPIADEGEANIVIIFKEFPQLKETRNVLNYTESRFKALVQEGSDLIAILDANGIYKSVSETSFSVLGLKPEHFINKCAFDFIHPEDKNRVISEFTKLTPKETVTVDLFRFKNSSGEWRWIESKITDFRSNPEVNGIVVNSRDVTERVNFRTSLEESEQKYRTLFEYSADGILLTSPNGEILAANPAARKMFQMTEEELCKVGRGGVVDDEDPIIKEAIIKRKKDGVFAGEFLMKRKDGSKFPVELSSAVFVDGEGNQRTSMVIRDVTDKKLAEEKLKASQQNYALMFWQNPIPCWVVDRRSLEILDVNEAAIVLYGYSKEEFLLLKITDLRPVGDIPHLLSAIDISKDSEGMVFIGSSVHLRKDGKPLKVEVSGYYLRYNGRDCTMVVCNDITEREEILQKLKNKREKLLTAQRIAKMGYWERNVQNQEILWTDEVYKIWEREKETFMPTLDKILASIHPEDLENFRKALEASKNGEKELNVDFRIILQDGSLKWVKGKEKLATNEQGKPLYYEGTFQDITESKLSIEKLKLSEARHRGILNSQTNYLVRADLEGNYTYGNQKFLNDFAWIYKGDIVGKNPFSSVHEKHHERVANSFKTCLEFPNKVCQVEMDKLRKGGEIVHTLWEFVCLIDSNGKPVEVQCVGIDITDRVKAEKLLRQSNERYDLVSNATLDAIYDWDCVSEEIEWNEGYFAIFGNPGKDSAPGTMNSWVNSIHPEDRGIVKAMYAALEGTQSNWETEYRIKKPDGELGYVLGRGFIVRDEHQKAVRMVGAIRDITEKKKLEELLNQASRLAKIGSFEVNYLKDTVYWSPVIREIHEVEAEFIPTLENATAFYKEESQEKIRKALLKAVGDNVPYDIELQIITAKGNERWVRSIGQPEFTDGKCVRLSGSFQDIDAVKRAELAAVRASEERQLILESIGDAFFAVNNDGTITYFNKHAENMLECDKDEVLGKNLWVAFADAVETDFYYFYQKAMAEKKVQNFEEYSSRVRRWFDVSAYPSDNGLAVYFRDITDRKKAHQQLLKLNEDLNIYTEELVNANKGLEQFSYIVSHNLRSPVANILGLAIEIEDETHPIEVQKTLFQELFDNVKRLDDVIKDLNVILQLKQKVNEWKEVIDLEGVVHSIKKAISHLVQKEQLLINTDFKEVPEINAIASFIKSIFYNLIHNSIKYRRSDVPVLLEIKSEKKNGKIIIRFKDNGLGIDLERQKDQLFGLYKRFHDHVDGKGMGLFMVKTQVEILGGKIEVKSEIDKGTEFIITFNDSCVVDL